MSELREVVRDALRQGLDLYLKTDHPSRDLVTTQTDIVLERFEEYAQVRDLSGLPHEHDDDALYRIKEGK